MTILIFVIQDYIQNHEIYSNMIIRNLKQICIVLDKAKTVSLSCVNSIAENVKSNERITVDKL